MEQINLSLKLSVLKIENYIKDKNIFNEVV